jgi:hypothetical protein
MRCRCFLAVGVQRARILWCGGKEFAHFPRPAKSRSTRNVAEEFAAPLSTTRSLKLASWPCPPRIPLAAQYQPDQPEVLLDAARHGNLDVRRTVEETTFTPASFDRATCNGRMTLITISTARTRGNRHVRRWRPSLPRCLRQLHLRNDQFPGDPARYPRRRRQRCSSRANVHRPAGRQRDRHRRGPSAVAVRGGRGLNTRGLRSIRVQMARHHHEIGG